MGRCLHARPFPSEAAAWSFVRSVAPFLCTTAVLIGSVPAPALAQTLRAIEIPEIVRWLRNGEAANIIVDRLTYRCLTQRVVRGTDATLRQAGATDVVALFVRQMLICPDAGGRDTSTVRRRIAGRSSEVDATESARRSLVDDARHAPVLEVAGGLGLGTVRAWFNPLTTAPRISSDASAIAGVGPALDIRLWPALSQRSGVGLVGAWLRPLYVGDGFSRADASIWLVEARGMRRVGKQHVFLDVGFIARQGARTRRIGVDSLRAEADFRAVRATVGLRVGARGDPLGGTEMSALVERASGRADQPSGVHAGVRFRWADGPIFVTAEYVARYAAVGAPSVLVNLVGSNRAVDRGGGNAVLAIGLRHAWRLAAP